MAHILVDQDNRCTCSCISRCVLRDKSGSAARCTKQELESNGYNTIQLTEVQRGILKKETLYKLQYSGEKPYNLNPNARKNRFE